MVVGMIIQNIIHIKWLLVCVNGRYNIYIYVCVENSKYGCEVDMLMIIYVFKNDVYIVIIDIDNGYM